MARKLVGGITALLGGALLVPALAAAEVRLSAGGYTWNSELEGTVASGGRGLDLDNDLDFGHARQSLVRFRLEHDAPLVPHVRLSYMNCVTRHLAP